MGFRDKIYYDILEKMLIRQFENITLKSISRRFRFESCVTTTFRNIPVSDF